MKSQICLLNSLFGSLTPFRFSCTDSLSWTANQSDLFGQRPPIQHVKSAAEGVGTAEKKRRCTTVQYTLIWVGRHDAHWRPDIYRHLSTPIIGSVCKRLKCVCMLPCFLQVIASVDVHPLDHGPVWNLQGGQTHGKVRLPRQNNWEW